MKKVTMIPIIQKKSKYQQYFHYFIVCSKIASSNYSIKRRI